MGSVFPQWTLLLTFCSRKSPVFSVKPLALVQQLGEDGWQVYGVCSLLPEALVLASVLVYKVVLLLSIPFNIEH